MSGRIGIIGGSGLYKMGIIDDAEEISVMTPFGDPSDKITLGSIKGVNIAFLPRHGKYHQYSPHCVNYQANIFALKECGVEYLLSIAAVGSLRKKIKPCDFVIANQLIDRTVKRKNTFFEEGIVVHVGFADPFCKSLSKIAYTVTKSKDVDVHYGTYLCIEGPQFSTRAESNLYRSWNADVIGMTLGPETKLAREAELCLCGILTVTDYDCWYSGEEDVSVSSVIENLKKNDHNMATIIEGLIPKINIKARCSCAQSLKHAVITDPDFIRRDGNQIIKKVLLKDFL
jgi:5'-methylthioadenosine phosphorylase